MGVCVCACGAAHVSHNVASHQSLIDVTVDRVASQAVMHECCLGAGWYAVSVTLISVDERGQRATAAQRADEW